jgi:hypothetical protein
MTVPLLPEQFDRAGAKAAGYSDAEIDTFLSQRQRQPSTTAPRPTAPDSERARLRAAGFSEAELDAHYASTARPTRPAPTRTAPTFNDHVAKMPNPKAERWDALLVQHPDWTPQQLTERVETEFRAAPAIARRGKATGASQVSQGITLGFSDEANAVVDALPSFGASLLRKLKGDSTARPLADGVAAYRDRVAEERARQSLYTEANPGTSVALQMAGGLVTGGAGAVRAAGAGAARAGAANAASFGNAAPSLIRRLLQGGAAGAGFGALGGAGASEAGTLGGVAGDAAAGAAVGGVLGGAAPVAIKSVGMVPRAARAAVGAMRTPTSAPAAVGESAALRLAKALAADGATPASLRTAAQRAAPSEMVADLAGDQTRRLVRGSEAVPSAGASVLRNALDERQAGQADRVQSAITRAFGADDAPDLTEAARRLTDSRKTVSASAYRDAYTLPTGEPRTVSASLLAPYMDDPIFRTAMQRARRQFDLDIRTGDAPTTAPIFRDVVESVAEDGTPVITTAEELPVAVLDYLKRGLDSVIEAGADGRPLDRTAARSYRTLRNRLLDAVDDQVPEYRAARRTYAGAASLETALQDGQDAMRRNVTRDALRARLADLSDGEAEQFRLGALGQLLEDAANVADGRDVTAVFAKSPAMRAKLDLLLPDDEARASVAELLASEGRQTATRRTISGSRTTPTAQDVEGLTDDTGGGMWLADALTSPRATASRALGAVGDRITRADRTRMADQLAPLLTMPAKDVERVIEMIANQSRRTAARGAAGSTVLGSQAGVIGAQAVRP